MVITEINLYLCVAGDRGPDVFYEVQDQVVQMLEEKYYQLFLTSDFYKNMLIEMAKEEGMSEVDGNGSLERIASMQGNHSLETTILLGDHSSYAKKKLNQLQEKLNNKVQVIVFPRHAFSLDIHCV